MKSVLITGATGLLGRAILAAFRNDAEWEVTGTGLRRSGEGIQRLDLTDNQAIQACVTSVRPDIIIHSAAERRPDVSEKDHEATTRLNVNASSTLAALAAEHQAWFIYISTDYVFDGRDAPYQPDAPTNPLNFYGLSKRDGENAVRAALNDALILRVPILYGPVETLEESAVTAIAKQLLDGKDQQLVLDDWATRYPTHVEDVGVVCRQLAAHREKHAAFGGTYHWSNDEQMTKYQMAKVMTDVLGLPSDNLEPSGEPTDGAPRPRDCGLDCSGLEQLGIGQRTPFAQGIREVLEAWRARV